MTMACIDPLVNRPIAGSLGAGEQCSGYKPEIGPIQIFA